MIEKLDFLFRFWELKARHAQMGLPLSQDEQQELLSLMQLVATEIRIPEAGPAPKNRDALPAQLIGAQAIVPVEVRALTASALVVSCSRRADPCAAAGKPVVLRATCAVSGVEYTIPCQVAWVHSGGGLTHTSAALLVDGVPTREPFVDGEQPTQLSGPHRLTRYDSVLSWPKARAVREVGRQ